MKGKAGRLIAGMMESADLERVLEGAGVTAAEALAELEGEEGKRQRGARRALAGIHAEMIALRFRALAASKLCGMLQEERLDLRMKAALAVLGMVEGEASSPRGEEKEEEGEGDMELMEAVAEVLAERRRRELMGAGPRGDETNHEGAKDTK